MTTISRSATRKIADLKDRLTECQVYTLDNYFRGAALDPAYAWEALDRFKRAKLTDNGDGTYTVSIHSNWWYKLREPKPAEPEPAAPNAVTVEYEGYVKYADDTVISIQCFEDRCAECPDQTTDDGGIPVLSGYYCEHGCGHGPAGERKVTAAPVMTVAADAELSPALAAEVGGLRGGIAAAAEKYALPARFTSRPDTGRIAMVVTDTTTGRSATVSLYAWGNVREALGDLFPTPVPEPARGYPVEVRRPVIRTRNHGA